jgi:SAM-dependent methyltransferase
VKFPFSCCLKQRRLRPELMDQPGLNRDRHLLALRGLERINRWSGSVRILWPPIHLLMRELGGGPLRVLDLASGAGDVAIGLWRRAVRAGFPLTIEGWDVSPTAVEYSRARAAAVQATVRFVQADALTTPIPREHDVIISSLFLHHLDEDQAVALLHRMGRAAKRLVLINDLIRCGSGLVLAYGGTRLLSTSEVVHMDGPRSVEGAFTMGEVLSLARRAGLSSAVVARCWPFRFLLTWKCP